MGILVSSERRLRCDFQCSSAGKLEKEETCLNNIKNAHLDLALWFASFDPKCKRFAITRSRIACRTVARPNHKHLASVDANKVPFWHRMPISQNVPGSMLGQKGLSSFVRKIRGFCIASENYFSILCFMEMCYSNCIAHSGGIARFKRPTGPTQLGPIQKGTQGALLPTEAAVLPSAMVAKNMCIFHSDELLSPKVLDLDGCFSSEKGCHCEVGVLPTLQKHRKNSSDSKVTPKNPPQSNPK